MRQPPGVFHTMPPHRRSSLRARMYPCSASDLAKGLGTASCRSVLGVIDANRAVAEADDVVGIERGLDAGFRIGVRKSEVRLAPVAVLVLKWTPWAGPPGRCS